jgi:hypothetical protein
MRRIFEGQWSIPLDRVGDMPRPFPQEESPTTPGTPESKKSG